MHPSRNLPLDYSSDDCFQVDITQNTDVEGYTDRVDCRVDTVRKYFALCQLSATSSHAVGKDTPLLRYATSRLAMPTFLTFAPLLFSVFWNLILDRSTKVLCLAPLPVQIYSGYSY